MLKSPTAKGRCIFLMTNIADICRECELASRNRELERRLSEMAIEVVALTEENRVLKLRLKEE